MRIRAKLLDLLEELFAEGAYIPDESGDEAIIDRIMECYGGEAEALVAECESLRAELEAARRERRELRETLQQARIHIRGIMWDRMDYTEREIDAAVRYIDYALGPTPSAPAQGEGGTDA